MNKKEVEELQNAMNGRLGDMMLIVNKTISIAAKGAKKEDIDFNRKIIDIYGLELSRLINTISRLYKEKEDQKKSREL